MRLRIKDVPSKMLGSVVEYKNYTDVIKDDNKRSPENWIEIYNGIAAYRRNNTAPVDYAGCEKLPRRNLDEKVYRFEVLVSLVLSAQTSDKSLYPVIRRLQELSPTGLSPQKIIDLGKEKISECLNTIGLAPTKTRYLLGISHILIDKWNNDIPDTMEGLESLPGVGPKIAALAMSIAWNNPVAIGVDVHVHRISNRLGWSSSKTAEQARYELESWLPKCLWKPINPLLVGFGQTVCSSVPSCLTCPVQLLCPRISVTKIKGVPNPNNKYFK